jgi:hypothetical protein
MGGIQFPAAAPRPARSLRRPEWRDTAPLDAVPRCTAVSKSTGCPCQAPALNDESRRRYSEELRYDVPAGLCAHHVKEHARQFHGIVPTWNFDGWPRCSQRTYKSGRTLPCGNPCMRGLNVCNVHGGLGAKHGHKGAPYGKLGWEKRRVQPDGAYRNQPTIKNVRVEKGSRPSYAHLISQQPRPQTQPRAPQTFTGHGFSNVSPGESLSDSRIRRPNKPWVPYGS